MTAISVVTISPRRHDSISVLTQRHIFTQRLGDDNQFMRGETETTERQWRDEETRTTCIECIDRDEETHGIGTGSPDAMGRDKVSS